MKQVLLPPCPTRPSVSPLLLSIITILQLRAKKERGQGAGDHAGGSPAGLGACLLVGGAHKTVEETRKKGTNRAYMEWYLLFVPGREDVESRSLRPAFSAPDARHAKSCSRCSRRAACSICSVSCSAGRLASNKVGTRRSKLTVHAAACRLAGACDGQERISGWNGTHIVICARCWQIDLD